MGFGTFYKFLYTCTYTSNHCLILMQCILHLLKWLGGPADCVNVCCLGGLPGMVRGILFLIYHNHCRWLFVSFFPNSHTWHVKGYPFPDLPVTADDRLSRFSQTLRNWHIKGYPFPKIYQSQQMTVCLVFSKLFVTGTLRGTLFLIYHSYCRWLFVSFFPNSRSQHFARETVFFSLS